jgi:hypothetical protein
MNVMRRAEPTRTLIAALLLFAPLSCARPEPPRAERARQAVEITQQYLLERIPNAKLSRFEVESRDNGGEWELTYRWQGDQAVPPSVFLVDKQTGRITSAQFHPFPRL